MNEIDEKNIGAYITNITNTKFSCKRNAAYAFASLIDMEKESAYSIVKQYCQGEIEINNRGFVHNNKIGQLERLAFFYQLIGISEDDSIIKYTKEKNIGFEYPPIIRNKKECFVNVSFNDENYSLKKEQIESLENLALIYAKSNYKK